MSVGLQVPVQDLTQLPTKELVRLVRKRKISPLELVDAHIDKIDRLNEQLNAYVFVDRDGARDAARRIAARVHDEALTLPGIPVSIKSSVSVEGFPWECGSRLRAGIRGTTDAPLVSRLRRAGAIILGATNVPEFLMAWETDNGVYGRTNSPWHPELTPGGSSGGESSAIAAGLSAGGVGSDGGGSIRVPAHLTGICGLKPTPGRIPATGHFPESAGPFPWLGVVGPMARTVADVRLLYEALAGPDPGDPCSAPVPLTHMRKKQLKGLRVGYFETDGTTPVAPENIRALRIARKALEAQGFLVEDFRPGGLDDMYRLWWDLFGRAIGAMLAPALKGREVELSSTLRQWIGYVDNSPPMTRDDLVQTLTQRDRVRQYLLEQMERFPILLCPVAAVATFRHGQREWRVGDRIVRYLDAWRYTAWFNLTGSPAISVPVPGVGDYPVGVQLVGRPWADDIVLGVASRIEKALGRQPPARTGSWQASR